MKKSITILLLALTISISAQYSPADTVLIEAEFNRDFNNPVILEYLHSEEIQRVNAALLCLSHSRDTSFIDEIIKLDFNRNPEYVSFGLGQLGASKASTNYLLSQLDSAGQNRKYIFASLGLTGDSSTADVILNNFQVESGIPTAMVDFFRRGIADEQISRYLNSALHQGYSDELLFEVLYAVYRTQPLESSSTILCDIAVNRTIPVETRIYALGSLRRLGVFESEKVDAVFSDSDWRIRVEGAKTAVYSEYDSTSTTMFDKYISLLKDQNPNVSRTAAGIIKQIRFSPEISEIITDTLQTFLLAGGLADNTMGEVFVSLCAINPENIPDFISKYEAVISQEYIMQALGNYNADPRWVFDYIMQKLPEAREIDLLNTTPLLLNLQDQFENDEEYSKVLVTLLKSEYPSTISIVADGIDSLFISNNAHILQDVVLHQCFSYLNNSQYVESIMSLANLSERISAEFYQSVMEILSSSRLPSIANLVNRATIATHGIDTSKMNLFNDIFNSAFEFHSATVNTDKGGFTIQLQPGYAPVSVGNFCMLAHQGYFDNVLFHRVVPDFVIQCGDTSGTGWGGPGYEIISEFSPLKYVRGAVGMASAGFDTEGSQWFVMHSNFPHLNGRYSVFGAVTDGMDTVDIIDQYDRIISVELNK